VQVDINNELLPQFVLSRKDTVVAVEREPSECDTVAGCGQTAEGAHGRRQGPAGQQKRATPSQHGATASGEAENGAEERKILFVDRESKEKGQRERDV
jgi:hypothetical protein